MAEEKATQKPAAQAPKVYQSEALDPGALKLKVRSQEAEEQSSPLRKPPAQGGAAPHTREMVLKLIERFKRL